MSYSSSYPHRARSGSAQSALRAQAKLAHEEETNENSTSSSKPDATFKHSLDETLSYAQYDVRNMSLCVVNAKNESESTAVLRVELQTTILQSIKVLLQHPPSVAPEA